MHLTLLVEDRSTEAFLHAMLPKVAPDHTFETHPFQGKMDLLRKLEDRLRGYVRWLPSDHRLIVLVDCDGDNCRDLKQKLETIASKAGLLSHTNAKVATKTGRAWQIATRLAIKET